MLVNSDLCNKVTIRVQSHFRNKKVYAKAFIHTTGERASFELGCMLYCSPPNNSIARWICICMAQVEIRRGLPRLGD